MMASHLCSPAPGLAGTDGVSMPPLCTCMCEPTCGHCFIGTDGVADSVIEVLTLGAELSKVLIITTTCYLLA